MEPTTLGAVLRRMAREHPEKVGLMVPGKDGYVCLTYAQYAETVRGFSWALRELGLKRGDRVCIQSENCAAWAYLDWASQSLGLVLVPIYPTLPADQSQFIAQDCEAALVISGGQEQAAKMEGTGLRSTLLADVEKKAQEGALTPEEWDAEIDQTDGNSVSTIIYTSGTTGNPKGAMLSHRAIIHVAREAQREIHFYESDLFLTYLPMSHVYERVVGQALPVFTGSTIAFAKSIATLAGDIKAAKPTVLLCVPRLLEAMMDRILDGVKKKSPLQQRLFHLALSQGMARLDGKFAPLAGILDALVSSKIREGFGGRMRFFVSGGAALPPHVARFYEALNLHILQGYGLTETAGGTCVNRPERSKYWTVGEPLDMEVKLAADGEILVRGPAVMEGYYNQPQATSEAIDPEGWFHTGDIGEFEGPALKITDRKKDILVLANGKNVAPQPIEGRLKESPLIQEAVLLGDGCEFVCALIVPAFDRLRLQLPDSAALSDSELTGLPDVRALIKAEVANLNSKLADFEKIKRHELLDRPFSIEAGELTPSLKVRRKVVLERWRPLIEGMLK